MTLKLVKEPDNEYDKAAIAVYTEDGKIGYVTNSSFTKYKLISSASELKNKIGDTAEGTYLFFFGKLCRNVIPYWKNNKIIFLWHSLILKILFKQ